MLQKQTRRTWSDADKESLLRKAAAYTGPLQHFLDTMHVARGWFQTMRKQFLKAHPEIDLTAPVVTVPTAKLVSGWPTDPEERKREMQRRRAKWETSKKSGPKPAAKSALDPVAASALAAYRSLPRAEKAPWREARRLSSDQLSKIARGTAGPNIVARLLSPPNGNRQLTVRDQRLTRLPDPVPALSMIPNSAPQPASVPCTLDDAILALEVKRDHLNEFIDHLKRMRSGR